MEAYGELRWKPIAVKTKCETGYVCPVTVTGKVMSGKYKAAIYGICINVLCVTAGLIKLCRR